MQSKKTLFIKITILLCSMMTVMAGATIAPSLPEMTNAFPDNVNAESLVKLVLTIPGLFIAITAPISGWAIDRLGRIKLLVAMLFLYGIAGTSGLYLDSLGTILVGRAFLGVAVGGIMTTAVTLIGDYFEGQERQAFLGTQAGIMALAGTVFITSGGVLADISWRYPFAIYGMAIIIIPLVVIFLKEPDRTKNEQSGVSGNHGIPVIAWIVFFLSFLGMATFYMMPVHLPFFIHQIADVGSSAVGIALALTTLVAGIASFNYPRLKNKLTHYQIYGISFLLVGIGFTVLSASGNYASVFPGLVIAGLGAGLVMPNSNLCLVTLSTAEMRGRILGLLTTFIFLGQFASPILTEPVINWFSMNQAFFYIGIALTIFSTVALIRNQKLA